MAAEIIPGQRAWELDRDDEGHRTYKIVHQVRALIADGPQIVMNTPGLPVIGSIWDFDNDLDSWAFCWPNMKVTPRLRKEPNTIWDVEQLFTTKPLKRCQDTNIEDPLLEPDRVSGSFIKFMEEAVQDKDGNFIMSSSNEQLRGPGVEFDANRPTVRVEQNVATLGLDVFSEMVDTLNDALLWGLTSRKIKLSNVSWERVLFGVCDFYYIRLLEFDVNFNTFDRNLLDDGTKVLQGKWDNDGNWKLEEADGAEPDPTNPSHYTRYKDRHGEILRIVYGGPGTGTGTGGGGGLPANTKVINALDTGFITTGGPTTVFVQKYTESDFLILGLPISL